jgi:hypothetical protein
VSEPFSAGTVLGTALRVWARNLAPFLLITTIAFVPAIVLALVLPPGAAHAKYGPWTLSVTQLSQLLASCALTFGVVKELQGERASLAACIATGVARAVPALAVAFVFHVVTQLGMLALVVPGCYLLARWFVVTEVAVLERRGLVGTFRHASELTAGRRLAIFGLFVVYALALLGALALVQLAITGEVSAHPRTVSDELMKVAMAIVVGSIGSVTSAAAYYYLRQDKEGTTAAELARVFE